MMRLLLVLFLLLPAYEGLQRPLNPLFEGTEFLEEILRDAPQHLNKGGKLVISSSNLGDKEFNEFAQKSGARVDRVLAQRDVAFRTEFLGDKRWVDYLVNERGMKVREDGEHGEHPHWRYWHSPIVREVSYS